MIRRFPRQATTVLPKQIQMVPAQFRQKHPFAYPEDNKVEFERWFYDNTKAEEITGERIYLPVFWTAYWLKSGYGKKLREFQSMQAFVNALDRNKKYFTICQYDDGPLVDFKDLDIVVFGMSGGRIDYPIPLLCQPHQFKFDCRRDIFASFIGSDTHPIRQQLVKEFSGKKDCLVTMRKYPLKDYCNILARSVFALCPRGYGASSFRIMEAIHYGAIPVYISNSFVVPYNHDFEEYGLKSTAVVGLYDQLKKISADNFCSQKQGCVDRHKHLFTYEGCKQKILENI